MSVEPRTDDSWAGDGLSVGLDVTVTERLNGVLDEVVVSALSRTAGDVVTLDVTG